MTIFAHGWISIKLFVICISTYHKWMFKLQISFIFNFDRAHQSWISGLLGVKSNLLKSKKLLYYDLFQNTIHDVYNTTINDLYNEISTSYSTLISDVVRTKINIISFLVQLNNIINFNRAPCLVLVSCIQIMLQNIKAHGVTW